MNFRKTKTKTKKDGSFPKPRELPFKVPAQMFLILKLKWACSELQCYVPMLMITVQDFNLKHIFGPNKATATLIVIDK